MDIREILVRRVGQQKQATGIVVGLIEPSGRRIVAYGHLAKGDPRAVDRDTIFEIGWVSKVFTSLLLADMVHRKEVALDDPAATYLPSHVRMATGHNAMLAPVGNSDLPTPLAGAGALRSSANDMLTLLEAFLSYKESPLAPAMNAMFETRRRAGQTAMGLGWFIYSPDGREMAVHNGGTGGFRSYVGYDPKKRIGVVVLSNASTLIGVDDIGTHLLNPKAPLANPEPPKAHTDIRIDPKLLDNYIGRYQVTPHLVLEITRDGGRLFAQGFAQLPQNRPGDPTGLPKFELLAEGENTFFARVTDLQITFETGTDGRATSLIQHKAGRDMVGVRL